MNPIPEYSSTNFFTPIEPLQAFLEHASIQPFLVQEQITAPSNHSRIPIRLEDKWKASKEVGTYLMNLIAAQKKKPHVLATTRHWQTGVHFRSTDPLGMLILQFIEEDPVENFIEQPLLSRVAAKETPLRRLQGTSSPSKLAATPLRPNTNSQSSVGGTFLPESFRGLNRLEVDEEEEPQMEIM